MDSTHIALDAKIAALEAALERVTKQRDDAVEIALRLAMKCCDTVDILTKPMFTYKQTPIDLEQLKRML